MKFTLFLIAGAALSFVTIASSLKAETLTTKEYVKNQDLPNVNKINFSSFDTNGDGAYSMDEVGERLYTAFDQDGNQIIDNVEWDKKTVMTVVPMEKQTFKFYDADDDGIAEEGTYTYETFYEASGLIRFDTNQDGLSAHEFTGEVLPMLDKDNDNMINLDEWKSAYLASRPKHNDPVNYNR